MTKEKNSKIYYGFILVAVAFLILILLHGTSNSFGIFFKSLQNEFGADKATISGIISLAWFLMGLTSIFLGRLTDLSHSYQLAFFILFIVSIFALIMVSTIKPIKSKPSQ